MPPSGSRWGLLLRAMPVPVQALLVTLIVTRVAEYCSRHQGCGSEYSNRKKEDLCSSVGVGYQMRHEIKKVEGSRCHGKLNLGRTK